MSNQLNMHVVLHAVMEMLDISMSPNVLGFLDFLTTHIH